MKYTYFCVVLCCILLADKGKVEDNYMCYDCLQYKFRAWCCCYCTYCRSGMVYHMYHRLWAVCFLHCELL